MDDPSVKTIIYLTDNTLDEKLAEFVRKKLSEVSGRHKIVSISQKPIDFGDNTCVGEIGRCWISLYTQLLTGAECATTKHVAIAEHDCLYTPEHFRFTPLRDDVFYYNMNVWFVQYGGGHPSLYGMYSFLPERYALSQLIVNRDLLIESVAERLEVLKYGSKRVNPFVIRGEFGTMSDEQIRVMERKLDAASSIAVKDSGKKLDHLMRSYLKKQKHVKFNTYHPNLDIRHDTNFTGSRRGKRRCHELPYWGSWKEVIGG